MHSFIRPRSALVGVALGALALPGVAAGTTSAPPGSDAAFGHLLLRHHAAGRLRHRRPAQHRLLRLVEPERLQPGGLRRHQPGGRGRRQRHGRDLRRRVQRRDPVQPDRGRRRLGPLRRLRHRAQRPGRHRPGRPGGARRRSDGDGAVPDRARTWSRSSRNSTGMITAAGVGVGVRLAPPPRTSSRSVPTSIPAAWSSSSASCSSRSTTSASSRSRRCSIRTPTSRSSPPARGSTPRTCR